MTPGKSHKKFYLGVKGLLVRNHQALLLKSRYSNGDTYWDLPGGRVSNGETSLHDTLHRELTEELPEISNIIIQETVHSFIMPNDYPNGFGLALIVYRVTADLPDNPQLTDEHHYAAWLTAEEVQARAEKEQEVLRPGILQAVQLGLGSKI